MKLIIVLSISVQLSACTDTVFQSCCIETMIDSYISSTSEEQRDKFMKRFNDINSKRVGNGFSVLDLCTEKYYFDRNWAVDDLECSVRVIDFENGNVYAIGNRQIPHKEQ